MQDTSPQSKKSIQLAVDSGLIEQAATRGVDVEDVLERALRRELGVRDGHADDWRQENADAIKSWNEELERNGLWSDGLRLF